MPLFPCKTFIWTSAQTEYLAGFYNMSLLTKGKYYSDYLIYLRYGHNPAKNVKN